MVVGMMPMHIYINTKKTGQYYVYSAQVQKNDDGTFTQSVSANNKRSSEYSTEPLSYLAIYIGTMADKLENACGVGISDIKYMNLILRAKKFLI